MAKKAKRQQHEDAKPRKRSRRSKGDKRHPIRRVVVALAETDALLALGTGALVGPAPAPIAGPSNSVLCWPSSVPAGVISLLERDAGFTGTIVFQIDALAEQVVETSGQLFLKLPVSISRVPSAVVSSAGYLELLLARVADFPDVVLDAVPISVDPTAFAAGADGMAPDLWATLGRKDRDADSERTEVRQDKTAGALAGLIASLDNCQPSDLQSAIDEWEALSCLQGSADDLPAMLVRVGVALSTEPPEAASLAFTAQLVRRLLELDTRAGFEPSELLREVTASASGLVGADEASVLRLFAEKADLVLRFAPGAPRDLLQDGGSIMLRGCLAFLQTPDVEKLTAAMGQGKRVGRRVGAFALVLAGCYTGSAALPRTLKASSTERLRALGDATEVLAAGGPIVAEWRQGVDLGGRGMRLAILQGKTVARLPIPLDGLLEVVAATIEQNGWTPYPHAHGLCFDIATGTHVIALTATRVDRGPIVPESPLVRLSTRVMLGTRRPTFSVDEVAQVASRLSLALEISGKAKEKHALLSVYLSGAKLTEAHVAAAAARLVEALERLVTLGREIVDDQPVVGRQVSDSGDTKPEPPRPER